MAKKPKITIVTPSYNQGKYLERTILSVLSQDYPNLEYIVIDGASTDNSVDIIKKYNGKIDYWVSEPDKGQSDAINKGFERSSGDILGWLNSDDYLLENVLDKIANFKWTNEIGAVVGIGHKVDSNDKIIYTPNVPELTFEALLDWVHYSHFMQPACFFSRKAWESVGPLNIDLEYSMDIDLWLKIAKQFEFKKIDHPIAHALIHDRAKNTAERENVIIETSLLINDYGAQDIAKKNLTIMTNHLLRYQNAYHKLKKVPLLNYILKPIARLINKKSKIN